jgi:hypothetical protein
VTIGERVCINQRLVRAEVKGVAVLQEQFSDLQCTVDKDITNSELRNETRGTCRG